MSPLHPFQTNTSPLDTVTVTDTAIVRVSPDGASQSIAWTDLQEVAIITTECSLFAGNTFWVLSDSAGSACAVPGAAAGSAELLTRLQELPGFNNEAVIEAMGSHGGRFVCWQYASGTTPD